jgi:hypothetical protein
VTLLTTALDTWLVITAVCDCGKVATTIMESASCAPGINMPTTAAVNSTFVAAGGTPPNLNGTEAALVTGVSSSETRFGDFSSVAIDPTNANGTCAVTAQQYFPPSGGGQWGTRIARVGTC